MAGVAASVYRILFRSSAARRVEQLVSLLVQTVRHLQQVIADDQPIALRAALYEAFRQAGMSQRRLARDLDVAESEVRRMLNPDHATKAATIDGAMRQLGKRLTVTVGEAA